MGDNESRGEAARGELICFSSLCGFHKEVKEEEEVGLPA